MKVLFLLTTLAFCVPQAFSKMPQAAVTITEKPSFINNPAAFKGPYPATKVVSCEENYFGTFVNDPYRWLEVDTAEDTKEWVERQNNVTSEYLSRIPFRDAIKKRLTDLWNYERFSAPFKEGDYIYFYKNDGLQDQYVLYRQKEKMQPEVFLDPNSFSSDGTTSLASIDFTKDGSLCAYQVSEGGSDWHKVIILDVHTKKQIGDTLYNVKFSGLSWRGNEGFYYSSYDKQEGSSFSQKTEQHKLFFHYLLSPQSEDELVFGGEKTPRRYVSGEVTEDQNHLIISAANATYGNELYIKSLDKKSTPITPIITGFKNEQHVVYAEGGRLFIITNAHAPKRKLVLAEASDPSPERWKVLIPETKFPLTVSTCGRKIFAQYIKDAITEVKQYDLSGRLERTITLPGLGTAVGFSGKKEETDFYYIFTSYLYPPTIFKLDVFTGISFEYKKPMLDFDPKQYETKQVFYRSKDGTSIPMLITYKKGLKLTRENPTVLYGYGGFGVSITPFFSVGNVVFMEKGGVYAVANIRGGGEYGDDWHNMGIKLKKQNVFDDFLAAAEFLIREKYTSPNYLAISGASNGGLLVGACMTQHPEYYKVCFPQVGVLDMLRYHKFTSGAGWAYDYGIADDSKIIFENLFKYSPVHNVKKGKCYPATMVLTGDHDDRVVPAHSFKFAAQLQAKQECENPVLIRIETKAGHGAGKPTTMLIQESVDKWAFLFYNMGITYK